MNYLREELTNTDINAIEAWEGGGGRSYRYFKIPVRTYPNTRHSSILAEKINKYGLSLRVFKEHTGIKLQILERKGYELHEVKNWFFPYN